MAFYNLIFTCSCIASTTGTLAFGFLEVKVVQIIDNEIIMRRVSVKYVRKSRHRGQGSAETIRILDEPSRMGTLLSILDPTVIIVLNMIYIFNLLYWFSLNLVMKY